LFTKEIITDQEGILLNLFDLDMFLEGVLCPSLSGGETLEEDARPGG
jgi:hypothetical protein